MKEDIKKLQDAAQAEGKIIGASKEREILELAIAADKAVLMQGDTGIGKTYILQQIAKEQGKRAVRVSLNGRVGIDTLVGKYLLKSKGGTETYWQDGAVLQCMRAGDWLILDEMNMAEADVLACLNSIMDDGHCITVAEKDGEVVHPAPGFRVFACINPNEGYAGTRELNAALVSRFPIVMNMTYPAPAVELEILKYQSGIPDTTARVMVDIGNAMRKAKRDGVLSYCPGTRDLVSWARIAALNGMTLGETFTYTIVNRAPAEDRDAIRGLFKTACAIELSPGCRVGDVEKLTDIIAVDIAKMEEQRKRLAEELEHLASSVKTAQATAAEVPAGRIKVSRNVPPRKVA